MSFDVTVVGGGLVGLTLALALANHQVRVRLFDRRDLIQPSASPDPRVVALNQQSISWLKQTGLWSSLDFQKMGVFESLAIQDHEASLRFHAHDYGLDKLGVILENQRLISQAQSLCMAHPYVQMHLNQEYQPDFQDTRLIIAADGAHSALLKLLHIPSFIHDYHQRAHVCLVHLEKPHHHEAWQIFLPTGPLAFLPLHEPNQASIVWTLPEAWQTPVTSESLEKASAGHYGSLQLLSDWQSFPLILQHASQYTKKNVVLLGDAIHRIHPLAGQGLNLGFADAQTLWKILSQTPLKNWTHPLVLKRYQRERLFPNLLMAHSMSAINALFRHADPRTVRARGWGINQLNYLTDLKYYLLGFSGSLSQ